MISESGGLAKSRHAASSVPSKKAAAKQPHLGQIASEPCEPVAAVATLLTDGQKIVSSGATAAADAQNNLDLPFLDEQMELVFQDEH